jgi:hypothetical protein
MDAIPIEGERPTLLSMGETTLLTEPFGRRPSFRSVGTVGSCSRRFEGPLDRTNVITGSGQIMTACRELRIVGDRVVYGHA